VTLELEVKDFSAEELRQKLQGHKEVCVSLLSNQLNFQNAQGSPLQSDESFQQSFAVPLGQTHRHQLQTVFRVSV